MTSPKPNPDLEAFIPDHFLIRRPMNAIVELELFYLNEIDGKKILDDFS